MMGCGPEGLTGPYFLITTKEIYERIIDELFGEIWLNATACKPCFYNVLSIEQDACTLLRGLLLGT